MRGKGGLEEGRKEVWGENGGKEARRETEEGMKEGSKQKPSSVTAFQLHVEKEMLKN